MAEWNDFSNIARSTKVPAQAWSKWPADWTKPLTERRESVNVPASIFKAEFRPATYGFCGVESPWDDENDGETWDANS